VNEKDEGKERAPVAGREGERGGGGKLQLRGEERAGGRTVRHIFDSDIRLGGGEIPKGGSGAACKKEKR